MNKTKEMAEQEKIKYYEDLLDRHDIIDAHEEILPDGSIDLKITLRPIKETLEDDIKKINPKLNGCKITK